MILHSLVASFYGSSCITVFPLAIMRKILISFCSDYLEEQCNPFFKEGIPEGYFYQPLFRIPIMDRLKDLCLELYLKE